MSSNNLFHAERYIDAAAKPGTTLFKEMKSYMEKWQLSVGRASASTSQRPSRVAQ
jgi:hypothetical protein